MNVIQKTAMTIEALKNCIESGNTAWTAKHMDTLSFIEKQYLPHGSGIDSGCTIDTSKSSANKIILETSFHHMDENGYYDGWTNHNIIITPAFTGIDIRITGQNKNDIKDYLADVFNNALETEYIEPKF